MNEIIYIIQFKFWNTQFWIFLYKISNTFSTCENNVYSMHTLSPIVTCQLAGQECKKPQNWSSMLLDEIQDSHVTAIHDL